MGNRDSARQFRLVENATNTARVVHLSSMATLLLFFSLVFPRIGSLEAEHIWRGRGSRRNEVWTGERAMRFLKAHPSRAYFANLFTEGGFRTGVEVGVAAGRFAEHFLRSTRGLDGFHWTMVEPFVQPELRRKLDGAVDNWESWAAQNISWTKYSLIESTSLSEEALTKIVGQDFVYLDGLHTYQNVLKEMHHYWTRVLPGGILAGHDYCSAKQITHAPRCGVYTEFAGKRAGKQVRENDAVVNAVQEFILAHPSLKVQHTLENFTRASLEADGYAYDQIITTTRSPSWYIHRPLDYCGAGILEGGKVHQNSACLRQLGSTCSHDSGQLSISMLYYGEKKQLLRVIEQFENSWSEMMMKVVTLIIIDDGSPVDSARTVLKDRGTTKLHVCVASITEDKKWNIGGARNLAVYVAPTEYILMVDIDVQLAVEHINFALEVIEKKRQDIYTSFPRTKAGRLIKAHPAVMLISKETYWAVGGNDEDFVGHYGYTDVHFKHRAKLKKCRVSPLANSGLVPPLVDKAGSSSATWRNPSFNRKLFQLKKEGTIPWSNDILRFHWFVLRI